MMIRNKDIGKQLVYGLSGVVYAMALAHFTWSLMGVSAPPIFRNVLFYVLAMALLILLVKYKRFALGLLLFLLIALWLTRPEHFWDQNLSFLWSWIREIYDAFQWGLTLNAFKGPMPVSFWWVLAMTASLLSFLFLYLLPFAPASLLILVLPLFYIPMLASHPHWQFWLFAGLTAITVSLYRSANRKNPGWPHPFVVAGLLLSVFLLQLVISPRLVFNENVSRSINRYYDRRSSAVHGSFSLERTGFVSDSGNLGGPVTPHDNPLLDVTGLPFPYYLRGSVYEEFTGSRWRLPDLNENRIVDNQVFFDPDNHSGYYLGHSVLPRMETLFHRSLSYPVVLGQYPRVNDLRTVFSPGFIFQIRTAEDIDITNDGLLERFWRAPETSNVFRYTSHGLVFSESAMDDGVLLHAGVVNMDRLRRHGDVLADFMPVWTEPFYRYRELVEEKDPVLYELFYEQLAMARAQNDALLFASGLRKIQEHFQHAYPYTLTPDPIPSDSELIPYFLDTKEGYCVYFGTLTAELLRDVGVSARYAEGFVVQEAENFDIVTLTGRAGHAWAEIEYADAGWFMFETTPAAQMDFLAGQSSEMQEENPEPMPDAPPTERPDEAPESIESPVTEFTRPEQFQEAPWLRPFFTRYWKQILGILFIAAWLLWRRRVFAMRHDKTWLRRHYAHRTEVLVEKIWHDLQELGKLEKIPLETGTVRNTVLTLAKRYSIREEALVSASIALMEQTLYGEKSLAYQELSPLLDFHHILENRIRRYMPGAQWYLKRWLWSRHNPL